MKYLIVECLELGDQFECDADRKPICITNDPSNYSSGYDIYEIKEDGSLSLIKEYDEYNEEGMILSCQKEGETKPVILQKWKNFDRDSIPLEIIKQCKFKKSTPEEIKSQICSVGSYQEKHSKKNILLTEYFDYNFNLGK